MVKVTKTNGMGAINWARLLSHCNVSFPTTIWRSKLRNKNTLFQKFHGIPIDTITSKSANTDKDENENTNTSTNTNKTAPS